MRRAVAGFVQGLKVVDHWTCPKSGGGFLGFFFSFSILSDPPNNGLVLISKVSFKLGLRFSGKLNLADELWVGMNFAAPTNLFYFLFFYFYSSRIHIAVVWRSGYIPIYEIA